MGLTDSMILQLFMKNYQEVEKMKIINVWGEASGRLGGMVFSRNKGGAYIRRHVTPTNPNSQKQRAVRERFSQRALEFRALPAATKAMWQEYVQTYYSPLTGSGKGTALNAFISNRQAVDNANSVAEQTTFDIGTQPRIPFILPTLPPTQPLVANIKVGEFKIVPFIDSVIYAPGSLTAKINLPNFPERVEFEPVNENNVKVSLNLYISSPSGGDYYSNPYRNLVAATAGYFFSEISDQQLEMTGQITLQANRNYRTTLVIMDQFGQQLPVSTLDFTVPAQP